MRSILFVRVRESLPRALCPVLSDTPGSVAATESFLGDKTDTGLILACFTKAVASRNVFLMPSLIAAILKSLYGVVSATNPPTITSARVDISFITLITTEPLDFWS